MGLEHVSDETICIEAMSQFYNMDTTVEDSGNYPSGCYRYGNSAYFNEDIVGTPRYYNAHRLCKAGNYRISF